ncbi:RNA polymerase sigma-70 factor [Larkinella harenae]
MRNHEMTHFQRTDADLVSGIQRDDKKAFRHIYDRYQEGLYRMAFRKIHSEEIAEEIVQEVFVNLWEKRHKLAIEDLRSYLFRAVRNGVLDYFRAQLVRQNFIHEASRLGEPFTNFTDDILTFNDLKQAIERGIDNLPEKTRTIFILNRLENRSAEEIASLLILPKRTVEYHITAALRSMRVALKDFLPFWLILYWL